MGMTNYTNSGSIEFKFFRPQAKSVRVMGDFNGWAQPGLPLEHLGDGWWSAAACFNPGNYRFRYLADGVWYTDFASNGVELTKYGYNSLLVVPRDAGSLPAAPA
jgi:1,4-alpha-glucan branching enzyme